MRTIVESSSSSTIICKYNACFKHAKQEHVFLQMASAMVAHLLPLATCCLVSSEGCNKGVEYSAHPNSAVYNFFLVWIPG